MIDRFQHLLDLSARATAGPFQVSYHEAVLQPNRYHINDASGFTVAFIENWSDEVDKNDAEFIAETRNNITPLIELLLMAEEALKNCEDVTGIRYKALAQIEAFREGK